MRTPAPRPSALAAVVLVGALAAVLSGCTAADQLSAMLRGERDVFSVGVGDCFDDATTGDVEEVVSVAMPDCTEPHDNEAYFLFTLTDAETLPYDHALITDNAEAGCLAEFETFVGIGIDQTSLYFGYLYPGEDSWAQGDREILCMAYDTEGPVSEPLAGKGAGYPL